MEAPQQRNGARARASPSSTDGCHTSGSTMATTSASQATSSDPNVSFAVSKGAVLNSAAVYTSSNGTAVHMERENSHDAKSVDRNVDATIATTTATATAGEEVEEDCFDKASVVDNDNEFAAVGNGCGEAVSLPSSCAEAFLLGPSLVAASRPMEWRLRSFSATSAAPVSTQRAPPPPSTVGVPLTGSATRPETTKPASFATQALQAITQNAASATAASPVHAASGMSMEHSSSSSLLTARVVAGEDPMGVRQLYSLPPSLVGSCVSTPPLPRRVAGTAPAAACAAPAATAESTAATATDAFSMERFATFYEVALEELMCECERRVANAPAAWRDGQRRFIRGDSNHDLATSTLSFDSPRSSGVSPVTGHAPQFSGAPSSNGPAYPPCYPTASHNTHGLHTRDIGGGLHGSARGFAHVPSLQPRHFFSGAARQGEAGRDVACEETVPALLAALGRHHGKMAPMVFIAALAYLARVTVQCASEFLSITYANWYRMTTTAILVAAKVYDEHSSTRLNTHFARSSGIPLSEMTKLELDFLYLIDFDLLLKEVEVEQWLAWMETLAVRRDLMTPLQTYFVHRAETTAMTSAGIPAFSSPPSSSLCSGVVPETSDKSRLHTAEASRTVGLSSEGMLTESVTATSPLSAPAPRTFTHVRVGSNTVFITKDAPTPYTAGTRRLTGASEASASCAIPLHDLRSPTFCSPASSLMMAHSVFDAPRSSLSGASLPGSATTPVASLRAAGVPPSPIHGVLPVRPPQLQTRLFSVVHGRREPPSPRTLRQLSQLGASPMTPLQPPPMEPNSPCGFFKQPHGGGQVYGQQQHPHNHLRAQRQSSAVSGRHGLVKAELATSQAANTTASTRPPGFCVSTQSSRSTNTAYTRWDPHPADLYNNTSSAYADATTATSVADASAASGAGRRKVPSAAASHAATTTTTTSSSSSTRWGPFGMVQQVRDVLGVTASLVRGQLNVLAPSKAPEEVPRPPSRPLARDVAYTTAARPGERGAKPPPPAPPSHRGGGSPADHHGSSPRTGRAEGQRGFAPMQHAAAAATPPPYSPGRYGRRPSAPSPSQHAGSRNVLGTDKMRSPGARRTAMPHDDASRALTNLYAQPSPRDVRARDYGEEEEEEEGEYDEEGEAYGYYGEDGYFYAYEDEDGYEGEDGEYYYYDDEDDEEGWYEEEEGEQVEAETDFFQRCRPPLTHSPPSL